MPLTGNSAGSLGLCHVLLALWQVGDDGCVRFETIGSEAAVRAATQEVQRDKQLHLPYLEQNIWSIASLLSRQQVKKRTCSHSKYFKSGLAPKVVHREVRIGPTLFQD